MSGIAIKHDTERSCMFTLVDASRIYRAPVACPTCGLVHTHKTYHLELDGEGTVIVSHEVLDRLRRVHAIDAPGAPFRYLTDIAQPPPRVIGIGGGPIDARRIVRDAQLVEPR